MLVIGVMLKVFFFFNCLYRSSLWEKRLSHWGASCQSKSSFSGTQWRIYGPPVVLKTTWSNSLSINVSYSLLFSLIFVHVYCSSLDCFSLFPVSRTRDVLKQARSNLEVSFFYHSYMHLFYNLKHVSFCKMLVAHPKCSPLVAGQ